MANRSGNILSDLAYTSTDAWSANKSNDSGQNAAESAQDDQYIWIIFTIVTPILFGIVTLVGILGNCLVIYVILSKKKMRTVTNLLLLNLAVSDLSFVLIVVPFTAYAFAATEWLIGNFLCKLMHYLVNVTAYVTVYTLVLISFIRFLTILYNVQTQRFRTKQNVVFMVIGIWVVMLLLNIPLIFSCRVLTKGESRQLDCDHIAAPVAQKIYATFFAFAYVLPLAIIGVLSVSILHYINKQKPTTLNKKQKSTAKKKQASRLIILVVVLFGICWLPIHIHLLIAYFGDIPKTHFYLTISLLWNVLAYFNSCINPIIYNYASKEFRDAFREVVCCAGANSGQENGGVRSTLMKGEKTEVIRMNSKDILSRHDGQKEKSQLLVTTKDKNENSADI